MIVQTLLLAGVFNPVFGVALSDSTHTVPPLAFSGTDGSDSGAVLQSNVAESSGDSEDLETDKVKSAELIEGWIDDTDYPVDASNKGETGTSSVKYVISESGSVRQCEIVASSGSASLDAQACYLIIARFKFSPGRDATGKRISESRIQNLKWELPEERNESQPYPAPFDTSISYVIGAGGNVTNCVVKGLQKGSDENNLCPENVRFRPFLDRSGRPIAKRVFIRNSLSISDQPLPIVEGNPQR